MGGTDGEGTTTSPFLVGQGDTLDMTVSQRSTYTDPDGTVFTCEPRATIKLFATPDTLYARDLATLLTVTENTNNTTQAASGSITTVSILQKFSVGGKEVTFNLKHEIYRHLNSLNKTIEMPYVRANAARYGSAYSHEAAAKPLLATVTGIRLKKAMPGPQARAATITDSTTYEVAVSFNLDLESVNTPTTNLQTLSFEVNFVGVVETTTEVPDPTLTFAYSLTERSGTAFTSSPYEVKPLNKLNLVWTGEGSYQYFSIAERASKEIRYAPKATVSLVVEKADTLWVNDAAELEKAAMTEPSFKQSGSNPETKAGTCTINVAGQKMALTWDYQAYAPIDVEGQQVALPYLQLSTPEIEAVAVKELPDAEPIGKKGTVYELQLTIKQTLSTVNVTDPTTETLRYVVKYVGAVEAEEARLVEVRYRRGYEWFEPHDNIPITYQYIVYRDRVYSNGEVITDEFRSNYTSIERASTHTDYDNICERIINGVKIYYLGGGIRKDYDYRSYQITYSKTAVPDLEEVTTRISFKEQYNPISPGDWKYYLGGDGRFNSGNPTPDWYWTDIVRREAARSRIYHNDDYNILRDYDISIAFYDKFLYIDNQLIDFLDYKMTYDFDFRTEDTTMPTGEPAKVFTHECKAKLFGRDIYVATVDTVYQYTEPPFIPSESQARARANKRNTPSPKPYTDNQWTVRYGGTPNGKKPSTSWQDAKNAVPKSFKGRKIIVPGITQVCSKRK